MYHSRERDFLQMPIQSLTPIQSNTAAIYVSPQAKKIDLESSQTTTPSAFSDQVLIDYSAKKDIAVKQILGGTLGGLLGGSAQALGVKGYLGLMSKMAMADGGGPIKGGESGGFTGAVVGSISGAVAGKFAKSTGQSLVTGAVSGGLATAAATALMGKLNGLDMVLNVSCGMLSGALAGVTSHQIGVQALKTAQ